MSSQYTDLGNGKVALNVVNLGAGGSGGAGGAGGITQAQLDTATGKITKDLSQTANLWVPSGNKARVYVIFGQSNAAGAAPIGDFSATLRAARTRTYTRGGSWDNPTYPLFQPGTNNRSAPSNQAGFDLQLTLDLEAAYPADTIYLINLAWGGSSLDVDWNPDVGAYFQQFVVELRQAFKKLPANAVLCGFLWNQGEADVASPLNTRYKASLFDLVNRLRRLFGFCPFIAGRIQQGGTGEGPRTAVQELASELPLFDWVDQDGFGFDSSGVHYTADGYNAIGSRYASKLVALNASAPIQRSGEIKEDCHLCHFQTGVWQNNGASPSFGILSKMAVYVSGTATAAGTFNIDLSVFSANNDAETAVFAATVPIAVGAVSFYFQRSVKVTIRRETKFIRVRMFPSGGAALTFGGSVRLITEI